jgi:hypothetical protein
MPDTSMGRIGVNLLAGENIGAELKQRNYPDVAIGKILGIYCASCARSCDNHLLMPDD